MGQRAVGALPRLVALGQLRLRLCGDNLAPRVLALGGRTSADIHVLHQLVAELVVERPGAEIRVDHLQPDTLDTA